MKTKFHQKGFSLVEMIVYIAILSFMLALIIEVVLSVTRSERIIKATRAVENSAVMVLERVGREVRLADNILENESVFDSHPGVLTLTTIDGEGDAHEVSFYLSEGRIKQSVDGVELGPLTEERARVTDFRFYHVSSSGGEAIRTELTLESGTSTYYRTEKFYGASTLR